MGILAVLRRIILPCVYLTKKDEKFAWIAECYKEFEELGNHSQKATILEFLDVTKTASSLFSGTDTRETSTGKNLCARKRWTRARCHVVHHLPQ